MSPKTKIKDTISKGLNILLVDDNRALRELLADMLLSQSFIGEVMEAQDGQDAIDKLLFSNPDVVIMDLNMPRLNGIEATKMIHQKSPKIPIIGFSIQGEPEIRQAMIQSGAIKCFHKGEEVDLLIETLKGFSKPPLLTAL